MLFNPFEGAVSFQIPQFGEGGWVLELSTAGEVATGEVITRTVDYELRGAVLLSSDARDVKVMPPPVRRCHQG